jgi:hypothetical protein
VCVRGVGGCVAQLRFQLLFRLFVFLLLLAIFFRMSTFAHSPVMVSSPKNVHVNVRQFNRVLKKRTKKLLKNKISFFLENQNG